MSDTRQYAVWPRSRSRSWRSQMCENSRLQRLSISSTNTQVIKRLTANYDTSRQYRNFNRTVGLYWCLIFVFVQRHVTFKLRVSLLANEFCLLRGVDQEVPYGTYLMYNILFAISNSQLLYVYLETGEEYVIKIWWSRTRPRCCVHGCR